VRLLPYERPSLPSASGCSASPFGTVARRADPRRRAVRVHCPTIPLDIRASIALLLLLLVSAHQAFCLFGQRLGGGVSDGHLTVGPGPSLRAPRGELVANPLVVFVPIRSPGTSSWERQILFIACVAARYRAETSWSVHWRAGHRTARSLFAVGAIAAAILTTNHGWSVLPSLVRGRGSSSAVRDDHRVRHAWPWAAVPRQDQLCPLFSSSRICCQTNPGGLTGGFSGIAAFRFRPSSPSAAARTWKSSSSVLPLAVNPLPLCHTSAVAWGVGFRAAQKRGPAASQSVASIATHETDHLFAVLDAPVFAVGLPADRLPVGPTSSPAVAGDPAARRPVVGGLVSLLGPVRVHRRAAPHYRCRQQPGAVFAAQYGLALSVVLVCRTASSPRSRRSRTGLNLRIRAGLSLHCSGIRSFTPTDGGGWTLPADRSQHRCKPARSPRASAATWLWRSVGSRPALAEPAVIGPNGSGKPTG